MAAGFHMKVGLRRAYTTTVPQGVRKGIRRVPGVSPLFDCLIKQDTRFHDEMYPRHYYESNEKRDRFAAMMVEDMVQLFDPSSVVDVGCGAGSYMEAFQRAGVRAYGVDLAEAAVAICRDRGLDVRKFDLTKEWELPWRGDLVISIEVAEHLPEKYAQRYVEALASAAERQLVLTAARPGQPGTNHFNCQPKEYWIERLEDLGLEFQPGLTEEWQGRNRSREMMPHWLRNNLMAFRRVSKSA